MTLPVVDNPVAHGAGVYEWQVALPPRLRLLASYAYIKRDALLRRVLEAIAPHVELMIDSGAFTDYHAGMKAQAAGKAHAAITVGEYVQWLERARDHVWQYVALDAIRDPDGTRRNLDVMLAAGLRPMPVVVYGMPPEEAAGFVDVNPHLCVAGGVDGDRAWARDRFLRVYAASGGRARIHALAYVKQPDMYQLPLASVDSSSFTGGERFGAVSRFFPAAGIRQWTWRDAVDDDTSDAAAYLRACGVPDWLRRDPAAFRGGNNIGALTVVVAHVRQSFHAAEHRGLRVFLACAYARAVLMVLGAAHAVRCGGRSTVPLMALRARVNAWQADLSTRPAAVCAELRDVARECAS